MPSSFTYTSVALNNTTFSISEFIQVRIQDVVVPGTIASVNASVDDTNFLSMDLTSTTWSKNIRCPFQTAGTHKVTIRVILTDNTSYTINDYASYLSNTVDITGGPITHDESNVYLRSPINIVGAPNFVPIEIGITAVGDFSGQGRQAFNLLGNLNDFLAGQDPGNNQLSAGIALGPQTVYLYDGYFYILSSTLIINVV